MASLRFDKFSEIYYVRFRFGGRPFNRSLDTGSEEQARADLGRIEETLYDLKRGRLTIPEGAEPGEFIVTGGKLASKPMLPSVLTISGLIDLYKEKLPPGAMEANSLATVELHCDHLRRILKPKTPLSALKKDALQNYLSARVLESWRGKPIKARTTKKELATLRAIWNWGVDLGVLTVPYPGKGLKYPKEKERPPFQTWEQIEQQIARGGLNAGQQKELWDCLFLNLDEINDCLGFVQAHADEPFIYPMFVFVAHTGARRSEIVRSLVDDFDFETRRVRLREKKKDKDKEITFRSVPISHLLVEVMTDWFAHHPGGPFALAQPDKAPLTKDIASHQFTDTLAGSRWSRIRGFHVFRHSFASNLAASGHVTDRTIDRWMGHQTEEMRKLPAPISEPGAESDGCSIWCGAEADLRFGCGLVPGGRFAIPAHRLAPR